MLGNNNNNGNGTAVAPPPLQSAESATTAIKIEVHRRLLESMDLAQAKRMGREQLQQVVPLAVRLGRVGGLAHGRHVAADRLAEVVDDAELDQPPELDLGEAVGEHQGHQAEAPGVGGRALAVAA